MIEVIATMCLLGTTADVHPTKLLTHATTKESCVRISKVYLVDPNHINPHSCMLNASKFARQWLESHPQYTTRLVGCRPKRGSDA
jgi:hypothetical protein